MTKQHFFRAKLITGCRATWQRSHTHSHSPQTNMTHKIKIIIRMIGLFFKEIYELITGKRKWS
jgi:hypothetical protein